MKMMYKMAALMGGMGIIGYMYLKKHPEAIEMMKEMGKDASRKMYNVLEQEAFDACDA